DRGKGLGLRCFRLPASAIAHPPSAQYLRRQSEILELSVVRSSVAGLMLSSTVAGAQRARARDLGVKPGVFPPRKNNALTDVAGVKVGHTTVIEGDSART